MNIILLSGGSGKRLWPLSKDVRSKQFLKIFKNEKGEYESMIQKIYKSLKKVNNESMITIAASQTQVPIIDEQIGKNIEISVEPCSKDTFPAIALATAYLHYVKKMDLEEVVVVCPVDSCVEDEYFRALEELYRLIKSSEYKICLMGIKPTYPSEKYGYIIPQNKDKVSKVKTFKEKPDLETAKKYIENGALWNGGVFAFKLKNILDISHKLIDFEDYYDLFDKYESLEKISFDYAVLEKEPEIQVMRYEGEWEDLGTWDTLTEVMEENILGCAIKNNNCENTHIINELNIPILCMGLKNIVVVASDQGILISDKEQSGYIKPYVEQINKSVTFTEEKHNNIS